MELMNNLINYNMNDFFLVYQPKVCNGKVVSLEALLRPINDSLSVDQFLEHFKQKETLDLLVIARHVMNIDYYKVDIPVSINIYPTSLESDHFVHKAIDYLTERNVILEIVEHEYVELSDNLLENIRLLKSYGIKIAVDDFGKDFARVDLVLGLKADQVKFDRSLVEGIESNYIKFKYLAFLYSKISTLCTSDIVFEGVENKIQLDLIKLFVKNPVTQGFYHYRPMSMEALLKDDIEMFDMIIDQEHVSVTYENNLDYKLFRFLTDKSNSLSTDIEINQFIKDNDLLGLVYNDDVVKSIDNLRNIYFPGSSVISNGVMSLIDATNKLVVMRNEKGVVIYDNSAHRTFTNGSIVGIAPEQIISQYEMYSTCIDKDQYVLNDEKILFHKSIEEFQGVKYETIREKMTHNDKHFVMTTICPIDSGLIEFCRDELTQCYNRTIFKSTSQYYHGNIVAFIDLNGFKAINDKHGHYAGDKTLVDFTRIISSSLSKEDLLVRYGGDEFVIVFDSSDIVEVNLRLIEANDFVENHFNSLGYNLSFSFGLAKIENNELFQAIGEADHRMYIAKTKHKMITIGFPI